MFHDDRARRPVPRQDSVKGRQITIIIYLMAHDVDQAAVPGINFIPRFPSATSFCVSLPQQTHAGSIFTSVSRASPIFSPTITRYTWTLLSDVPRAPRFCAFVASVEQDPPARTSLSIELSCAPN
jgi:hypothetical protein